MQIVLTDVLTCPRCGPDFGLVVLADRLHERRVFEGSLGCANCRETYAIHEGLADLRFPTAALPPRDAESPSSEDVVRLAALLGITHGPGLILVAGPAAAAAGELAELVPEIAVVAVGAAVAGLPERVAVSRVLADQRLPLRTRSMRGVALTGAAAELLEEGTRVLFPGGRLVLDPAPPQAAKWLQEAGLTILLDQERIVVASRAPAR